MAVVSACETGLGEFKRGEGIIGLARGFAYAGVASMMTSLWGVNDYSTEDLMISFYKSLKLGNSKDLAIQKAKLKIINRAFNDMDAHPFYWAGLYIDRR